jgi:hypothetical protein
MVADKFDSARRLGHELWRSAKYITETCKELFFHGECSAKKYGKHLSTHPPERCGVNLSPVRGRWRTYRTLRPFAVSAFDQNIEQMPHGFDAGNAPRRRELIGALGELGRHRFGLSAR